MSDLVQRLRSRGCGQEMFGFDGMLDDGDPLLIEAADEIERLRAALLRLDALLRDGRVRGSTMADSVALSHAAINARAALKEKP